jgi:fatty acid synthase subunit alpha, fungi type
MHYWQIQYFKRAICNVSFRIETQDVILAEKEVERIVEIGPSNTLTAMAQKTMAYKYEAFDAAHSLRRQFLCSKTDAKEIYYEFNPVEPEEVTDTKPVSKTSDLTAVIKKPFPVAPESQTKIVVHASLETQIAVPDVAISAAEIMGALVAAGMKKPLEDISFSESIKALSAGMPILSASHQETPN